MEINMVKCANGHFYNAALHSVCPDCVREGLASAPAGQEGFTPTEPLGGAGAGGFTPTEALGSAGGGFTPTEPIGGAGSGFAPKDGGGSYTRPIGDGGGDPFGRTMIGGPMYTAGSMEPVVGWLVCIEGPMRGMDYRIHAGYNYIGREQGDIHVAGDMQISHANHALIAYDHDENAFYFGPSAGRNIVKVNGKAVLGTVEIHSHDVLSLGKTRMLFVALCGEKFRWEGEA